MRRVRKLSSQLAESLKKRPVITDAPRRVEQVKISPPRPARPEVDVELYDLLAPQPVPVLKHSKSAPSAKRSVKKNARKGHKDPLSIQSIRRLDCPWMDPSLREDPFQCARPSLTESETSTCVDTKVDSTIDKGEPKKLLSTREREIKPLRKRPYSMLAQDGSAYGSDEDPDEDPLYDPVLRDLRTAPTFVPSTPWLARSPTRQPVIRHAVTTSFSYPTDSAPPQENWDVISVPGQIPRRRRYLNGALISKSIHVSNNSPN